MEKYPNRLKERIVDVDFPLMVQEISEHGYTMQEIADLIGDKAINIQQVKQDRFDAPKGWKSGQRLMDMYLQVTHKTTLPFI